MSQADFARKRSATTLALVATVALTLAKLVAAVLTGSVGVLSEAIHSGLDMLSSIVTFFVVRASDKPADFDHPYGHGKIESLSAMFEAFLLLVAAGYILYEGFSKWVGEGHHLHHVGWGLGVIAVSVVVNLFVYFQNRGVAHEHESIAIETNAFHFLTDVFSSLAVFAGLAAAHFTGLSFFDPLVAIVIAAYIFWVGIAQFRKCVSELSDSSLPDTEVASIRAAVEAHSPKFLNYHDLRTRRVGATRHVDFHMTVCSQLTVHESHEICDGIEGDIDGKFKSTHVNIHVEPCGYHGPDCEHTCPHVSKPVAAMHHHPTHDEDE